MLLELIIVIALILALYGFIDFTKAEGWVIFFGGIGGFALFAHLLVHFFSKGLTGFLYPTIELKYDAKKEEKIERIRTLIESEQYETAEREFNDLIKKYPKDKKVSDNSYDFYMKLERYQDCIDERRRYISQAKHLREDEKCTLYNRIADVYLEKLNNPDGAVFALRQLINEFPNSPNAQFAHRRIDMIEKKS